MNRRAWTLAEKQFLKDHTNWSIDELAAELGRTYDQVSRMRVELSITRKQSTRQEREQQVRELHARGLSDGDVAGRLLLSKSCVTRIRNRLQLPPNGWTEARRAIAAERVERLNTRRRRFRKLKGRRGCPAKLWSYNCKETYSSEQLEWLKAVDSLARRLRRQPTLQEAFHLAQRLGYRKIQPGAADR